MSMGMGVMLHVLGGGSKENPEKYYGRVIASAERVENRRGKDSLRLRFTDGTAIRISDEGQSCCEHRYMRTDDNLQDLVGHKLVAIETNAAATKAFDEGEPPEDDYGDAHEAVFLDIKTDDGMITFSFHNEHNGYYGGFGLCITEEPA